MKGFDGDPGGIRVIYDLLVKAAEYPGESYRSAKSAYAWYEKIRALHEIMRPYWDDEYGGEHREIEERMKEASLLYPGDEYVAKAYAILGNWIGVIASLYDRLGLLIPQNLVSSDSQPQKEED